MGPTISVATGERVVVETTDDLSRARSIYGVLQLVGSAVLAGAAFVAVF